MDRFWVAVCIKKKPCSSLSCTVPLLFILSCLISPRCLHRLLQVQLQVRQEGDEIVVTAQAFARSVEVQCGADTVLSDNYFDMNAGERRVRVLRGTVESLSVRSVYDIR